ncbi:hypothetical protein NL108_013327, partial [Boleophthalmus pectinirostris]
TWVGNKRRKLASKADQNGAMSHSLSSHSLSAGLLSNHTLPVVRGNTNNNNNDVILTGIYSLNSAERSRQRPVAPPPSKPESQQNTTSFNINLTVQNKNNSSVLPLQSKPVSLAQNPAQLPPSTGAVVHNTAKKTTLSSAETGVNVGTIIPQSWTRQYGTANTLPWSNNSSPQIKTQPRPHSNPQPQSTTNTITPQKVKVTLPVQNSNTPSSTPRIQQVFTLSEKSEWSKLISAQGKSQKISENRQSATSFLDTSHNFSIAMETGDEEDEWQREEELANMAAQTYIQREQRSPNVGELCSRSSTTQQTTSSKSTAVQSNDDLHGYEAVAAQTLLTTESSSQTVSATADPWVLNNSRKRTLQDRTQFSDGDLVQLKRYWDRGMTSLGSVCKDKINAAANQLNVDTEIVKTWISNRRRKYRLMGIEIPPPKGGPAVFTTSPPGNESPVALSPDVDRLQTPDLTDDTNDGLNIYFSSDGTISSHNREGENDIDMSTAPLANNVKIEVSDDDEEVNEDGVDMMASDLEQMQSLLEFK